MDLKPNEKKALEELRQFLKKKISNIDLWVFGSKARQNSSSESDIDVMIIVDSYDQDIQAFIDDVTFELNLQHNCLISTVVFSRDELEKGPMSESPLYKTAVNEGLRF